METPPQPLHPGRILYEQAMKPLNVSRNKLARDIDVPVGRISDIVSGKRGVTPDTALRLAKYFGTSAELWMRLQSEYDLYVARTTTWARVEPRVRAYEEVEGGVTHSLPGETSSDGDAAAEPAPELPFAGESPVADESSAPDHPPVSPRSAGLDVPAPPGEPGDTASETRSGTDVPPLRAVRRDALAPAAPADREPSLVPGRPGPRLDPSSPSERTNSGAKDRTDESLEIPEPEEPFLLDPRFEIKSD